MSLDVGKLAKRTVARLKVGKKSSDSGKQTGLARRVSPQTPTTKTMSSPQQRVANYVASIRAKSRSRQ